MVRDENGPPAKQAKKELPVLPANVIIQFQNDAGETVGEAYSNRSIVELFSTFKHTHETITCLGTVVRAVVYYLHCRIVPPMLHSCVR